MRKLLPLLLFASCVALPAQVKPVQVKVVVVTMFEPGADTGDVPGEFQFWVEREGLTRVWPFPQGYRDLRSTPDGSVLGLVTGVGNIRSSATITALGHDPRFDLTHAYWLVAGIAGGDPQDAPLGSAVWAEWVVDGDLAHEIDAREIPADWPTGYVPLRGKKPYEQPAKSDEGEAFHLDPGLVSWAYESTRDTPLEDTPALQRKRALYKGFTAVQRPPCVMRGDTLSSSTYWHGEKLNEWANEWVKYHTGGAGNFVTTAMEDTGTLQALHWLANAGLVDVRRALVLRATSNFDMQWPGATAAESLTGESLGEGYSAYIPSLEAAQRAGSRVVHALVEGWSKYETELPSATGG